MLHRKIAFVILLLACLSATAQPPETIYPGTIIRDGYVNNASYGPYNIGFSFSFYGTTYNQFYVNSNGMVSFGAGYSNAANAPIPTAAVPNNFIAAFWDDLVVDDFGTIMYTTIGSSPNRKCIIQFRNMGFYFNPVFMGTFYVILYETSNKIQVQYRLIVDGVSAIAHGSSATVGIENSGGTAGVKYAYSEGDSVSTSLAVSFTPVPSTSSNYILDKDDVYDGVFLTRNESLPEPGITKLVSPSPGSVIGADHLFEWNAATNNTFYTLYISTYPDLTDATVYSPGNSLSYAVTGLTLDQTYYWGVFSNNTTGRTWCEIKSFSTSSAPALASLPRTIWVEQGSETLGTLQYTGGDGSTVTGTVTSIPAQGSLYQVSGGVAGTKITTVPTVVTDPGRQLIYIADGGTGNGVGNFNFYVTDNTGDAPPATITINVSPPGIPNVLVAARSTGVEIQFDIPMNDPAGKESQFTVSVNGSPVTVTSIAFKPGDQNTYQLTLATPLAGGDVVLVSYTQGDVTATTGGVLLSFTDEPVTLLAQTINFPVITPKKYGDADYTPGASAPGGAITYSSSTISVATIVANRVRFVGVGSSVITARQAGDATYAPAKYERPLTVNKGDQTITFGVLPEKTYGDVPFALTASSSAGLAVSFASDNPAVASVSGSTVTIHKAGSAVITASQSGNALWNPAPDVPRTLTVNKAAATVALSGLTTIYSGVPQQVTATTTPPGLTVTRTYDGGGAPTNAGSYAVVATIADDNYQGSTTGTFEIAKASLTATAEDKNRLYGAVNPTFTLSYTGFVNSEDATVLDTAPVASTTANVLSDAGTAAITVSGGADNNYSLTLVNGTLTIDKAPLTVTADDKTRVYGVANPPLTISYSGFVNSEGSSVIDTEPVASTTADATTGVGTVPITLSGGVDNNYTFIYTAGVLTITKATASVTLGGLNTTYTGLSQTATATTDPAGLAVTFTYDGLAAIPANAGSYAVVATVDDTNYEGTATGTLVIAKAQLTATADDKTKVRGEVNPLLTITYTGFVNGDDAADLDTEPVAATTADATTGVGTVPITVSGGSDNNYNFIYVSGVLTITPPTQTITFGALVTTQYGDLPFALTATASSGLPVSFASSNEAVATISGTTVTIVGTGTAIITATQPGNTEWAAAVPVEQTLTVNKAMLQVVADSKSKPYLDPLPQLTFVITGFVNGEDHSFLDAMPVISTTALQTSSAGAYPISVSGGSDNNYTFTYTTAVLTITRIAQFITIGELPGTLVHGTPLTLSATSTSGLVVSFESTTPAVATVSGSVLTGIAKGLAQVRAYNNGDINYMPAEFFAYIEILTSHAGVMYLFTPNNDGFNDLWEIPDLNELGRCEVRIFNRWGKQVYANSDYNNTWDGTSNGAPLPEGAYPFIIKTENQGVIRGTLNIVR